MRRKKLATLSWLLIVVGTFVFGLCLVFPRLPWTIWAAASHQLANDHLGMAPWRTSLGWTGAVSIGTVVFGLVGLIIATDENWRWW